jgi:hypothetical protein
MGGIGKTSLYLSCAEKMQDEFKFIIWRSLRHAPTASELLTNLLHALFPRQKINIPKELDNKISLLLDRLRQDRCLIVLDMEEEVLYWLAIAIEPISLSRLRSLFISFVTQAELIEALSSLLKRSLIETKTMEEETLFSIEQPVIAQYVIKKAIEKVVREIQEVARSKKIDRFEFLRNHALIDGSESDSEGKELRARLILTPVKERLYRIFRNEKAIETQLQDSIALLQGQTPLTLGYIKENLENLLAAIKADLHQLSI